MEILFETDYTKIEYDSENDVMILKLIGNIKHDDYKNMWNTLLEKVLEKDTRRIIADQTSMERSSMESKAWLVTRLFPKIVKQMGKEAKVVMVASKSIFTRVGGEYLIGVMKTMSNFDIKIAKSTEEAYSKLGIVKS